MVLDLMTEQVKKGWKPVLASIGTVRDGEKPIEAEAWCRGLRVKTFRMRSGPNWAGALRVLRFARRERIQLFHCHGYKGNILFGFLPRKSRPPIISTLHGWTAGKGLSKMRIYEWLDRVSLRFIDAVVLVNKGMVDHPAFKGNRRISPCVVNNGIPQKSPTADVEIDPIINAFCHDRFVIGALGRLSPEKGIHYLIDAFAILQDRNKSARLLLLGDGEQRQLLESKIRKLGLEGRVLMPGYLADAARYLSSISVLAMPSLTEGMPITLLEAMRAGIPIVASKVGGIPHVLMDEKSALLVPPGDPDDLAHAIGRLYDQPAMGQALAGEARLEFQRRYTSEQMALGYQGIYEKVLSPNGQWNCSRNCCGIAHT